MTIPIQHLVLSGGGHYGFAFLGMLEASFEQGLWKWEDIQSIHGTSVGALIGAILCLQYNWQTLINYFIQRPWSHVFSLTPERFIQSYEKNGLFQRDFFTTILEPLLKGKDLSIDITLKQFFETTGIVWVGTTFEIHSRIAIKMSHLSHPDLSLVDAIYRCCAIPVLFTPVCTENGDCFMDGALENNYPIPIATDIEPKSILGFRTCSMQNSKVGKITVKSNLYETMMVLTQLFIEQTTTQSLSNPEIGGEFIFYQTGWEDFLYDFQQCFLEESKRKEFYLYGKQIVLNTNL
jgi:predicted acylesterase/phospholipase RssA